MIPLSYEGKCCELVSLMYDPFGLEFPLVLFCVLQAIIMDFHVFYMRVWVNNLACIIHRL